MTLSAIKHPVELLRDGKGIYGIGAAKEVENDHRLPALIMRRDRLPEFKTCISGYPILQRITGGFRHGMFCHTLEEHLRQVIHHGMLRRAGLAWPPPQSPDAQYYYWSSNPRQQARNRQIYHGLRQGSLSVVNRLIGQALEEAADQKAVEIARRFSFRYRFNIYRATVQSPRALQIAVEFPALAFAIIENCPPLETYMFGELKPDSPNNRAGNNSLVFKTWDERKRISLEALALVEAGAPLKTIAARMRVPMAFRKIKPGAAGLALTVVNALHDERLLHAHMPDSLPLMKLWLRCINLAGELGPEFIEWTAKHSLEIGGTPSQVLGFLSDLTHWVDACHRASVPPHILNAIVGGRDDPFHTPRGEQFVVRQFSPDMSLKTVAKLSRDWHEAVANNMSGPFFEFPEPWCCAGEPCGYEIVPIANNADLYREGRALHHCVGTQGHRVQAGEAYFYSIRKDKERVATLELLRDHGGVAIGQLRGPCNSQAPKEIVRAVKSWLRSQREFRFPKERVVAFDALDGEIPF